VTRKVSLWEKTPGRREGAPKSFPIFKKGPKLKTSAKGECLGETPWLGGNTIAKVQEDIGHATPRGGVVFTLVVGPWLGEGNPGGFNKKGAQ